MMTVRHDSTEHPDASADPSWDLYPDTILELHDPAGMLTIDLRDLLGRTKWRLAEIGPSAMFGVVTSANPRGQELPDAENESRLAQFQLLLSQQSAHCLRADGLAPDRRHREKGFAIWLDRDALGCFAKAFDQSAFFWFDGDAFWVVGALVNAPPLRLPR
ncbi:MAG: DUF3293 domain-containing protein [Gemmatimonadaceae bacterium]